MAASASRLAVQLARLNVKRTDARPEDVSLALPVTAVAPLAARDHCIPLALWGPAAERVGDCLGASTASGQARTTLDFADHSPRTFCYLVQHDVGRFRAFGFGPLFHPLDHPLHLRGGVDLWQILPGHSFWSGATADGRLLTMDAATGCVEGDLRRLAIGRPDRPLPSSSTAIRRLDHVNDYACAGPTSAANTEGPERQSK